MEILLGVFVVFLIVFIKVEIDLKNWTKVNHGLGIFIVALVLVPLVFFIKNPFPLFLYAAIFNPSIALAKGLDFFYLGNTSFTDKLVKRLCGSRVYFFFMLFMAIFFIFINKYFQ